MPASSSLPDRVRAGDPRALARALSLVEDDPGRGAELVRRLYPFTGRALLVGVTGPPGAGKSTLVDRLTSEIRRAGKTVGVIAVDPTSPFTGGAILGDRVRMGAQSGDADVFIRSMAARGHMGGLARATADAALVLDAAGKDVVIVETVGVGQGEIEVVRMADVTILTLVPGTGDDIQALKAGIMEIADIFVVNKADHDGAERLVQAITSALTLKAASPGAWATPVLKTVAIDGTGVPELWQAIEAFRAQASAVGADRRRARHEHRLRDVIAERLLREAEASVPPSEWRRLVDAVASRDTDPYSAADEIIRRAGRGRSGGGGDA